MLLRDKILAVMQEIAEDSEITLISPIEDGTLLLETGLDSIGFAILVARLEEELDYDPFTMMENAVYPRTFQELVDVYQKH